MATETSVEREFKFDIDPEFDPPDLRAVVGHTERLPEQHLTTTYLDTPDRRLWACGITLRHRLEAEGDAPAKGPGKWTLKLPEPGRSDEGVARSELSWTGSLDAPPEAALAIVGGVVRRAALEPVVVLSTDRRRLLLHGDERPWAEVDDDLATVASGGQEGFRFRQLEIELLEAEAADAPPQALGAVLSEMRRAGATPGGASKLALAAGLEERTRPSPAPRSDMDVRSFVGGTLSVDLDLLLEADYRLRVPWADGDPAAMDEAAVRAAASAVRRLRADLRVLGAVLDPVWTKHVRAELRWAGALLDRLEAEDVLVGRVVSHHGGAAPDAPVDPEAVDELVRLLRSDRHLGATDLIEGLGSDRYADLLDRLHAAVGDPPLFDVAVGMGPEGRLDAVLRSVVSAFWRALRAELDEMGDRRPTDDELDHVRVLAVRLAHAAAMAEPVLGKKARKTAAASSELQSILTRLHRSVHAARELAGVVSHPAVTAPVAFAAGLIAGRAQHETAQWRSDWPKAAKRIRKAGKALQG